MVIVETTELEVVPCTSLDTRVEAAATCPAPGTSRALCLFLAFVTPFRCQDRVFPKPPQTSKWGNGRGSREDSGRV